MCNISGISGWLFALELAVMAANAALATALGPATLGTFFGLSVASFVAASLLLLLIGIAARAIIKMLPACTGCASANALLADVTAIMVTATIETSMVGLLIIAPSTIVLAGGTLVGAVVLQAAQFKSVSTDLMGLAACVGGPMPGIAKTAVTFATLAAISGAVVGILGLPLVLLHGR